MAAIHRAPSSSQMDEDSDEDQPVNAAMEMTTPPVGQVGGRLPNTLLAAATISFALGSVFALGLITFLAGGLSAHWWTTYQAGFFVAAWAAFHWGEFAVTAGWNREKCSIECEPLIGHRRLIPDAHFLSAFLLDNGSTYHIANSTALVEYMITLYFKPSWKATPYLTPIGEPVIAMNTNVVNFGLQALHWSLQAKLSAPLP